MKKILLILTGGTIGSRIDANGNISPTGEPLLLTTCKKIYEGRAKFCVSEPFTTLSENMTLAERELLIKEILKHENDKIDGIIVAHGSDTLCFTAALCSMALRHLDIPLVFIASDLVLSNPKSNGPENFESAISLICSDEISRGCFICYKDINGENSVYLPTRLSEAEPIFDSFVPYDKTRFGYTDNGKFIYEKCPIIPSLEDVNSKKDSILPKEFSLSDSVIFIRSSAAFNHMRINVEGLSAVVNYGYHCGTVNEQSFLPFTQMCKEKGVDIILASFKDPLAPIYESLAEILKNDNVKRLYNISPESALAKTILAYSIDKRLLDKELYFEHIK